MTAVNTETKTGPQRDPVTGRVSGGNPGNKGGTGQPKDKVRAACAFAFEQRIPVLKRIADGKIPGVTTADRIKAMDLLGKYGGLQKIESEVRDLTLEDLMRDAAASDPVASDRSDG